MRPMEVRARLIRVSRYSVWLYPKAINKLKDKSVNDDEEMFMKLQLPYVLGLAAFAVAPLSGANCR